MSGSRVSEDTDFKQQRLRAWQPILTPRWVICSFITIGIIFPIIGAILVSASNQIGQVEVEYSSVCQSNPTCIVELTIPKDMQAPVYFYYKLTNFYQNHRRYVKSKSNNQLQGLDDSSISSNCDPLVQENGKTLYPCGLIAASFFTDKFNATIGGNAVSWTSKGIAWPSDVNKKYVKRALKDTETNIVVQNGKNVTLPDVTDEEFIVWMRVAGLPTFKKLNRIIQQDLKAGDVVKVEIQNNYDVSAFSGTKSLVISNTNWLGGKNDFLGYAYIGVGVACLVLAIAFAVKHLLAPRPLGDVNFFRHDGGKNHHIIPLKKEI